MRLLLDSHALLWSLEAPEQLRPEARDAIRDPSNEVFVSAASVWELAIKQANGRLEISGDLVATIEASRFEPLPITQQHSLAAGTLPPHHRDPFDRMLIAQAAIEGLTIVTRYTRFEQYGVSVLGA